MTQWFITSSLLILAVLVIRFVGRDRLSGRVRYALWGLVLLRLLMPFSIGESALSVRNWLPADSEELLSAVTARRVHTSDGGVFVMSREEYRETIDTAVNHTTDTTDTTVTGETSQTTQTAETNDTTAPAVQQTVPAETAPTVTAADILPVVWVAGMVIVGGVFLVSNLRFWLRLRRSRRYLLTEGVPVYESAAVETPCLFGFPRAAVYVTAEVAGDTLALRHVLAHELTHYRHKDHIWSLLRCICVTLHWYNPLVWLAAYLSRQDGELACDEGALRRLDDGERIGYARTLLDLTCVGIRGMLTTATSMTGTDSDLKARVLRIVKNPKMTASACALVVLLAAVIGVMVFTDKPDELEGTWAGAWTKENAYPAGESLITVRATFRDGQVRMMRFENDEMIVMQDYSYSVEDDVLYLKHRDYEYTEEYPFVRVGESGIEFVDSDSWLWSGLLTKVDPTESALVKDALIEIRSFTDLSRNGEWEISDSLAWLEGYIVDTLQRAEVLSVGAMPAELTYTDYCYGITAVENGKAVEMILSDGWLYRDGMGYELSDTKPLLEQMWEVVWEPVGGYRDECGMEYSLSFVLGMYLEMNMEHDYRDMRFYSLANEKEWQRAWEEAAAHNITGEYDGEKVALYLFGVADNGSALNVYPDGTIVYFEWPADENGTKHSEEHYVRPEEAPKLMELLAPYLQVYAESAAKGENQQKIYGGWNLTESPDPRVTDIYATMNIQGKYHWSDRSVYMAATVDGCMVETEFDIYLQDGLYHIRWKDGREKTVPYTLDGDTLTLHDEQGTWVFEHGTAKVDVENTELIRFTKQNGNALRLDLSDEKLSELEALLRAGMVERESNIIYWNTHYYKLLGLEDAFDTEDITLSDYGTMHFNNDAYDLTNWEEIEAFFDTLYRVKY